MAGGAGIVQGAPWAFIAVMGVTGAGKTTFIQTASGDQSSVVGHGLKSCTSEIKDYNFHYAGYNIKLVDSPGFNDTFRDEADVLQDIAEWLKESYESDTKLNGIIYLHNIQNVRMEGSALRNLRMFRELCGKEPLKNVILVTSFWDNVDRSVGETREEELQNTPEFWEGMIRRGSRVARFLDRPSALNIIFSLVERTPVALSIQQELVDQRKRLIDTKAGQAVNEELARLEEKHQKEREKLQKEMEDALKERDVELQEILQEQRRKLDDELEKVHRQQAQLQAERRADRRRLESQLGNRIRYLESRIDISERGSSNASSLSLSTTHGSHSSMERPEGRLGLSSTAPMDRYQEFDLEYVLSILRANESKIRPEERRIVELTIKEVTDSKTSSKKLQKKIVRILLSGLQLALPVTTMALLGFPVHLPSLSNSSETYGNSQANQ